MQRKHFISAFTPRQKMVEKLDASVGEGKLG